jgi:hypothetical protein
VNSTAFVWSYITDAFLQAHTVCCIIRVNRTLICPSDPCNPFEC